MKRSYTRHSSYAGFLETLEQRQLLSTTVFPPFTYVPPVGTVQTPPPILAGSPIPAPVVQIGTGLTAEYFRDGAFQNPVFVQYTSSVNLNWGKNTPDPTMSSGNYSVRWTGQIAATKSEVYSFYEKAGGALRLWVNDQLIIDASQGQSGHEVKGTITLQAGQKYNIRMEYVHTTGNSSVQLSWSTPHLKKQVIPITSMFTDSSVTLPASNGLLGQYFLGKNFDQPLLTRTDSTMQFNFAKSGNPLITGTKKMSIRWVGQIQPAFTELYTFYTNADDGVRLWVDGQLVVNDWSDHKAREKSGTIALVAGQKYDIRVEYYNNGIAPAALALLWSSASLPKQIIDSSVLFATPPASASNLQAIATDTDKINLQWTGSPTATGFLIQRSDDGLTWTQAGTTGTGVTTYTDEGLQSGHVYYYRVHPVGPVDISTFSNQVITATPPAGPASLSASSISSTQIALAWAAVNGATGYVIQRSLDGIHFAPLTSVGNVTSYQDSGLLGGTLYYYRVQATNATGSSTPSTIANSTTNLPSSPAALLINAISNSQINLLWATVPGADGYMLQRSSNGTTGWQTIATPTASVLAYQDTGLNAGTTYYYRLASTSSAGNSSPTSVVHDTTAPAAPTQVLANATSASTATVTWSDLAGELGFTVLASLDNGAHYLPIGSVSQGVTTFNASGLLPATTYLFEVQATNAAGSSAVSNPASATTVALAVSGITASAISPSQINLIWTPTAGATGYVIQRSLDGVNFSDYATSLTPSYHDISLLNTTQYFYRVLATNSGGRSSSGSIASATTLPVSPLGLTAQTLSNASIALSWVADNAADGYIVQISSGGPFTTLTTLSAPNTTYNATGLDPNTTYSFRIISTDGPSQSAPGAVASATTLTGATTSLIASTISATQLALTWSPVSGASGYQVERSPDGTTNWTSIGSTLANTTAYADTTVAAATTYYYRVRVANDGGLSAPTAAAHATTLTAAPTTLLAAPLASDKISLSWTPVIGSTGYAILMSTDGTTFTQVGTTDPNINVFEVAGLSPASNYIFKVTALSDAGTSAPSNPASAATLPASPLNLQANTNSISQILLDWDAVSGATGYTIERSANGTSGWTQAGSTVAGVTAFVDTNLASGTTYYYRVSAVTAAGSSTPSTVANAITKLSAPANLQATGTGTTINLTWTAATGATSYIIQRSPNNLTNWAQVGTSITATYADTSLPPETTYYYRVIAVRSTDQSAPSLSTGAATVPAAPGNLIATALGTTATLVWTPVLSASGYTIERSLNGIDGWSLVTTTNSPIVTTTDPNLALGTTYFYRVTATNAAGNSAPSATAFVATAPTAPANLLATSISSTEIDVSWNDVANETGFLVERSLDGTNWIQVGLTNANVTTFADTNKAASTVYHYRVHAFNLAGNSAASNADMATTAPLVTFTWMSNMYGVNSDGIFSIDTTTSLATWIGTTLFPSAAAGRDPVSGKIYYVESGTNTPRLAAWDPATGESTIIATLSLTGNVTRAAFRADGKLFLTAGNADLYQVDRLTGVATSIGTIKLLGIPLASSGGDIAFSPTGTLYLQTSALLYTVNTSSAAAALAGTIGIGDVQIAFGQNGTLYATTLLGSLYALNLTTLVGTLLGTANVTPFDDLASSPLYADLSVTQSVSSLIHGHTATYTINTSNAGPASATGVTIIDTLPNGATFQSATGTGWTFAVSGSSVTMTYTGTAAANAALPAITLKLALASSTIGAITNSLSISSLIYDSALLNNSSALLSIVL